MRSAVRTMVSVQVPFPVEDIDDFWANHTTELTGEVQPYEYAMGLEFLTRDAPTIYVRYKGQEAIVVEDEYRHWYATYHVYKDLGKSSIFDGWKP